MKYDKLLEAIHNNSGKKQYPGYFCVGKGYERTEGTRTISLKTDLNITYNQLYRRSVGEMNPGWHGTLDDLFYVKESLISELSMDLEECKGLLSVVERQHKRVSDEFLVVARLKDLVHDETLRLEKKYQKTQKTNLTTRDLGSKWKDEAGGTYILCRVGIGQYALINLFNGNRWCDMEPDMNIWDAFGTNPDKFARVVS